jgi:hypothetical protein
MVARLFANPRGPVGFQELKNTSFFQAFLVTRDYKMGKSRVQGPGKKSPVLRRGACYVRASHKPETSEIPSEQEMRELLELAIDKGVVKFLARVQKAGLLDATVPLKESDPSRFRKQVEEME